METKVFWDHPKAIQAGSEYGTDVVFVFSVDLVCKEELNLMLKYRTSSQGGVGLS